MINLPQKIKSRYSVIVYVFVCVSNHIKIKCDKHTNQSINQSINFFRLVHTYYLFQNNFQLVTFLGLFQVHKNVITDKRKNIVIFHTVRHQIVYFTQQTLRANTYARARTHTHTHTHTQKLTHTYTHTHTETYTHTLTHTESCTHRESCTHTHTHARARKQMFTLYLPKIPSSTQSPSTILTCLVLKVTITFHWYCSSCTTMGQ
jgi:hypothetical protein